MKPPSKLPPARKRNLAAKALRDPLFRPKIMENPGAYKRRDRFNKKPVDQLDNEQINRKSDDDGD